MNRIIVQDDFLDEEYLHQLEKLINIQRLFNLNDKQGNHVNSYSEYDWNMIITELRQSPIRYQLIKQLEEVCGMELPKEDLNQLQMFAKMFEQHSFIGPHSEKPELYGPLVYMLYLTDEVDGCLHTDGLSITPKRNRLVVMRVGFDHWVDKCSGTRLNITGWPFASDEIIDIWKTSQ